MPQIQPFTSDAPLFYNPAGTIWAERGYAVPNYGRNEATVNRNIERFTSEAGLRISQIMHHPDGDRRDPPSLNTIIKMVEFVNRARVLLVGHAVPENQRKFEGTKISSPRRPFRVFPCPFFKVENQLMRDFCEAGFAAVAEFFQSTEIGVEYDFSEALGNTALRYVQRFQQDMAMDYFGMAPEAAKAPDLDLSKSYQSYTPLANGFVSGEQLDIVGTLSWPQDVDLGPLARGIMVQDLPTLGPYPYADTAPANTGAGTAAGTGGGNAPAAAASNVPPFPAQTTYGV